MMLHNNFQANLKFRWVQRRRFILVSSGETLNLLLLYSTLEKMKKPLPQEGVLEAQKV